MKNTIENLLNKYKKFRKKSYKKILFIKITIVFIVLLFFVFFKWLNYYPNEINLEHKEDYFGITFSTKYTHELGLEYKEVYQAILNDLKVKKIRIPFYWDEIEKNKDEYNFEIYDYLINEGKAHDIDFIISVGRRVPRWPECHSPNWTHNMREEDVQNEILEIIEIIVNRYKENDSIEFWQIENEAFLGTFGVCPPLDENFLKSEFELVSNLDKRERIITSSGELKFWNNEAKIGDIFGTTVYRIVYNSWFGFVKYPLPTNFYHLKAKLAGIEKENMMVLELQTEPWVVNGSITQLTEKEINKSLSIDQFKANLQYSINLDLNRVYTWGVEWWYFEKLYGNENYWEIAKELF